MKKCILVYLALIFFVSAKGQYFDWNKVIESSYVYPGDADIYKHLVARNGAQILGMSVRPCSGCWPEYYEYLVDSGGSILANYINFVGGNFTNLFFDYNNHIVELTGGNTAIYHLAVADTFPLDVNLSEPDLILGDSMNNLYVFYSNPDLVEILDSTGMLKDSFPIPINNPVVTASGEIFTYSGGFVKKFSNNGMLLHQYPATVNTYAIAKSSGKLWVVNSNLITCYDSIANIIYDISMPLNGQHISIAADIDDNLCLWKGNGIYKYLNDSLLWSTLTDASNTETIGMDGYNNIYYASQYAEPFYDGGEFLPGSYSIPPSISFIGMGTEPVPYDGETFNFILGKINNDTLASFSLNIASVLDEDYMPVNNLCTFSSFYVFMNYDHLPVMYDDSTLYIELSDSSGSFVNPLVIGHAKSLVIRCVIPDGIPSSNGYQIRARLGITLISLPYTQIFSLNQSPLAPIYLDNSINGGYSCSPFTFITNADSGLYYEWFYYEDAGNGNFIQQGLYVNNDTLFTAQFFYDCIAVTVTDVNTQCSRTSNDFYPTEIDTITGFSLTIYIPDTVHINDLPFNISASGYNSLIYGSGVYFIPGSGYVFYPDSVSPGLVAVMMEAAHTGTPCVPYIDTAYIYVDSILLNIIVGDIEPSDKIICRGDTFDVPFTLFDSTMYDSTNVFIVEMGYFNPVTSLGGVIDVGYGTESPIKCLTQANQSGYKRFRIRSSQTGEKSTLNSNGNINLPYYPNASFGNNQVTVNSNCFPVNYPVYVNSSPGQHQWLHNSNLILDSVGANIGITPPQSGDYTLTVIDIGTGCTVHLPPFHVTDSAHVPSLTVTPDNSIQYSCGKVYPVIVAHTDSLSSILWYKDSVQIMGVGDTLATDTAGIYNIIATSSSGCTINVNKQINVKTNPPVKLDVPLALSICPGHGVMLSVNNQYTSSSYTYRWLKNDTLLVSTNRQFTAHDTAFYKVVVKSNMTAPNCTDTSQSIHVTYSNIQIPSTTPSGTVIVPRGQTLLLTTPYDSVISYQWYKNGFTIAGANQNSFTVAYYGNYTVKTSFSQNCFVFSNPVSVIRNPYTIEYERLPEVEYSETEPVFAVYPNPNKGEFYLSGENVTSEYLNISVEDIFGRLVFKTEIKTEDKKILKQISLNNAESGVYILHINSDDYSVSLSLIVN